MEMGFREKIRNIHQKCVYICVCNCDCDGVWAYTVGKCAPGQAPRKKTWQLTGREPSSDGPKSQSEVNFPRSHIKSTRPRFLSREQDAK